MDLQLFNREAEQAESWMGKRETFLASDDLGTSLDSVEALIRKYEDIDKSLQAQVCVDSLCAYFSVPMFPYSIPP